MNFEYDHTTGDFTLHISDDDYYEGTYEHESIGWYGDEPPPPLAAAVMGLIYAATNLYGE